MQGRPFVGKAGQNLTEFLTVLGLRREAIRITNVVKVRPTKESAKGRLSNRPPNRQELAYFIPLLLEEIAQTQPKLLVTLGNTALQALLGKDARIGDCHGQRMTATVQGQEYPLYPLYHPASIIYNRALKEVYLEDLEGLRAYLEKA